MASPAARSLFRNNTKSFSQLLRLQTLARFNRTGDATQNPQLIQSLLISNPILHASFPVFADSFPVLENRITSSRKQGIWFNGGENQTGVIDVRGNHVVPDDGEDSDDDEEFDDEDIDDEYDDDEYDDDEDDDDDSEEKKC